MRTLSVLLLGVLIGIAVLGLAVKSNSQVRKILQLNLCQQKNCDYETK